MRSRVWLLWLAVGLAPAASAQTPQGTGFTYQGRLSDGALPANGAYDFKLTLYDAATGGAQVGPIVTRDDVAVANGLFTIVLDFGPVFDGRRRFLDVGVRPGASTGAFVPLTPRQELTPAPATLFSAATPWGGVSGKPAGFADDVDNDSGGTVTSVTAGPGLAGGPITTSGALSVAFGGPGTAATAARSDHDHDAVYVRNTLLANPGTNNVFGGVGAGASQTTGAANTYFGASAGAANATSGSNSFFGFNAGRNTTGGNNSFFGDAAGFSNTTGGSAFFGFLAGFNNTTGGGNSFFGRQAGRSNTTASGNSFFGDNAGFSSTALGNSFFGRNAGIATTTGAVNSFFGEGAGTSNTTGGGNVFVGRDAAFFNVTGSRNIVVGSSTGQGNTSGSDLTIVGTFANVAADGLSFATAIGAGAVVGGNNMVVLGRPVDTVLAPGAAIVAGTLTTPTIQATDVNAGTVTASVVNGHSVNATVQFNIGGQRVLTSIGNQNTFVGVGISPDHSTGSFNTIVGSGAGFLNSAGDSNTYVGQGAGANTIGGSNTFIGAGAGSSTPVQNAIAIGAGVQVAASGSIVLGKTLHTTTIPGLLKASDIGAGNFGLQVVNTAIGGGVVAQNLYVRQLNQTGSPAHLCWRTATDGVQALLLTTCTTPLGSVQDKADVRAFAGGLDIVERLLPVSFSRKDSEVRDVGLSAEDVAAVAPQLVARNGEGHGAEVQTEQLIAVLVSAIKEQQSQIEALKRVVCASRADASVCK